MQATETPVDKQLNTRRINRMPINLPVKIEGLDTADSAWEEITRLRDVSAFGAGFTLSRPVRRGRLIKLTLPMPRQMRCYDYFESQYTIWAIVRRCLPMDSGDTESCFLGVAFIGKVPPKSFLEDPSLAFDITHKSDEEEGLWEIRRAESVDDESHLPKEDRRHSRYDIPVNLTVEIMDKDGRVIESEPSVAENISLGGACILTSLTVEPGALVRVSCPQYDVTIKAIVRGRRVGPNGIPRLHIEFVDQFFPLSGIID